MKTIKINTVSLRANEVSEALRRAFACSGQVLSLSKDEAIPFRLLRPASPSARSPRNDKLHMSLLSMTRFILLALTLMILFFSQAQAQTPEPCNITQASWPRTTVEERLGAGMNITATGDCYGRQANFEVRRDINGVSDALAFNQPFPNPIDFTPNYTEQTVATFNTTATLAEYTYTYPTRVSANQIKIAYNNDAGARDLRVDRITVDGVEYQSEASSTYCQGHWDGASCAVGFLQTEWLQCNGYFAYDYNSPISPPAPGPGSVIRIYAQGIPDSGVYPVIELRIRDVANYRVSSTWQADSWLNPCAPSSTCDPQYFFRASVAGSSATPAEPNPRLLTVTRAVVVIPDTDWPQLGRNAQRWQYHPNSIQNAPFPVKWAKALTDYGVQHRIYASTQVIMADVGGNSLIFVGSNSGTLFAFGANSGNLVWQFVTDGPINHTAGYQNNRVFVANLNGSVYAINAATGSQIWRFNNNRRFGFTGAVLLAEDKVFAVDSGGYLYALSQNDGRELWHYNAGAGVVCTPSYNNGKVFFGSEDTKVHAVNSSDGTRAWLSNQVEGLSFIDTWPVIINGRVITTVWSGFEAAMYTGAPVPGYNVLDENTGNILAPFPHDPVLSMNGPHLPPAVSGDGLITAPKHIRPDLGFGGNGWVLIDPQTNAIIETLNPTSVGSSNYGVGAPDEQMITSIFGNIVVSIHHAGLNWGNPQWQSGTYDRTTGTWTNWPPDQRTPGQTQLYSLIGAWGSDNAQAGGAAALSGKDDLLCHQSFDTVKCFGR